jgi:hypothetical protein
MTGGGFRKVSKGWSISNRVFSTLNEVPCGPFAYFPFITICHLQGEHRPVNLMQIVSNRNERFCLPPIVCSCTE